MNFRIVLHLLKCDFQRLKRPLVWLWILLLAAALPFLLDRPGDFQIRQWVNLGWNGRLDPFRADIITSKWSNPVIYLSETLATVLALILASRLGAQWVKQAVTPVRGRERFLALALSLLLFIVLPQWLLAFSNLLLLGFSPGIAVLAAGAPALTALLLLGLASAFAAWLPSPWLLLAGCAALASTVAFISMFHPPLDYMIRGYPVLPLLPAGPKEWLFGTLAIALLVILLPVFRRRLNGPWKSAVAVALILLAGIPAALLPPPDFHVENDPTILTASIRPKLRDVRIQMTDDAKAAERSTFLISASLESIGCPPDHAMHWEPTSGWVFQDGKRVATLESRKDRLSSRDHDGYFTPDRYAVGTDMAAMAALPGNSHPTRISSYSNSYSTVLGSSELTMETVLSPDREAELHMEFTGTVFRYERVWDVPLDNAPMEIRAGNLTWRVKRIPSDNGEPWADVMVTHPALGISRDPDHVHWDTLPISHYRLYFLLPASGTILQADNQLMNSSGPLFSGAGCDRQVLAATNQSSKGVDLTGLRLILLKPVPVARFTTTATTRFRPWMTGDASDYALMHRYPMDETVYRREWFPNRPDPQTASREEFARWLRIPASVYRDRGSSQRDLACYAPRFAGLMAKVGNYESVAEGLRLGTPESLRDEVIGKIDSLSRPDPLANVALARGWLNEASASILQRFNEGGMWGSAAVMALENPSTYPELISRFQNRPERETYEKLRLLPGIEPLLGEAIDKAARETPPSQLKANFDSQYITAPFGPYLYAAKRGNAQTLETILDLYKSGSDKSEYALSRDLGYVVAIPDFPDGRAKALSTWLREKSAASFRFDPLLRIWNPLP